jgi:hypothetical protein
MVVLYIYSICWRIKLMFYEHQQQIAFLGHVISARGVSVDPGKVRDVLNWMPPTNVSKF